MPPQKPPRERARELRLQGLGVEEIAQALGEHLNVVRNWLRDSPEPARTSRGEYRPRALTDEQWADFKRRRDIGESLKGLAEHFGVSLREISRWVIKGDLPRRPKGRKKA